METALRQVYLNNKKLFRANASNNAHLVNSQFLIELAGFKTLSALSDEISTSWFKSATKQQREAVLDLALVLDANRASKILEAAIAYSKKILKPVHKDLAIRLLISFGQTELAKKLGPNNQQLMDANNPFKMQKIDHDEKLSWLREFLSLGAQHELSLEAKKSQVPIDSFHISSNKQSVNKQITTVAIIAQKPDKSILRTINSVLATNEAPMEILVMQQLDTAKGYRKPVDVQQISPNVKTIMISEKLSLAQILNKALDESMGKYLMILNQGEFIHPETFRLLRPKAEKKAVAIATKQHIGNQFELQYESSSLALINKQLAKDYGYFDKIKLSPVELYLQRIKPSHSRQIAKTLAWSEQQTPDDQLLTDACRHYLAIQKTFVDQASRPFVRNTSVRTFYSPRPIRFGFKLGTRKRELPKVVALNLASKASLAKLQEMLGEEKSIIGIWDLNCFWNEENIQISNQMMQAFDQRKLQFVYPEEKISIDKLLILDGESLIAQNPRRRPKWDVVDFEVSEQYRQATKTLFPVSEL